MKTNLSLLSFIFFHITTVCLGQYLDSSELKLNPIAKITNYTRSQFNADPQFWTMCEDNQGITIFGNNDGAVFFDGNHWNKINLPNKYFSLGFIGNLPFIIPIILTLISIIQS